MVTWGDAMARLALGIAKASISIADEMFQWLFAVECDDVIWSKSTFEDFADRMQVFCVAKFG